MESNEKPITELTMSIKVQYLIPLLYFAMKSLVHTTRISSHAPYGKDRTY